MSKLDDKLKNLSTTDNTVINQPSVKRKSMGRPFPKGVSGNPKGRPPGRPNYVTDIKRGIEKLAKENHMSVGEFEVRILAKGLKGAAEGDYQFYRDYLDRLYGKPVQPLAGPADEDGNDGPILIKIDL